ncbi:MAG: after-VIT domain-containing protein, partial [Pseudanabaena sp.]
QNLHFRLQLAHSRKAIKGNQQQIANLIEAVTSYCDRWLAQDDFETLDHVIEVPKLSKLKLTTLQLFDLYESIELCANEFVILPNVSLEVRRLNLNWLKIMAGAIAIVGVSIGTIRLIYLPSGEQPSYQIAATPNAVPPEQAAAPPAVRSDQKSDNKLNQPENNAKVADSAKSANSVTPNSAIATAPNAPKSVQEINPVAKPRERTDKVAIAPEPMNSPIGNSDRYHQGATTGSAAMNDGVTAAKATPQGRLEVPNKDTSQAPVSAEAAKTAPSPSTQLSVPAAASRAANSDMATTANITILQIKSEVPNDITTDLVHYLQSQRLNPSTSGTIALDLEITGDRISNIATDNQNSTLKDGNAIAELDNIIRKWRSPSSVIGKVRVVLQVGN